MRGSCSVADCEQETRGNTEWCELHYRRARRFGDPTHLTPLMLKRQEVALFWDAATSRPARIDGPCMEWPGARGPRGYGRSNSHSSGETIVSRIVWHLVFGPIPAGLQVCHHCDNPPCARPTHLFLGTALDNARDMVSKGRHVRVAGEDNARTIIPDAVVEDMRRRWIAGATCKDLALEVGVNPATVSRICRGERRIATTPVTEDLVRAVVAGPKPARRTHRPRVPTELDIRRREVEEAARAALLERIVDLYGAGKSTIQIGREVDLDASTVYRRLAAVGVPMRSTGDYHPTPDLVELAARYTAGEGIHALAKRYRVTSMRVAELIRSTGTEIRRPGRPSNRRSA